MYANVAQLALELLQNLILGAVQHRIERASDNYFTRRKIRSRIENAVAVVAEPLVAFFDAEKVDSRQQEMLLRLCAHELEPLLEKPQELFRGSLDGAKIFERLYPGPADLPQAVREEGLAYMYALLMPRMADCVCRLPMLVEEWEREKWHEDFRRLDLIAHEVSAVMHKVDTLGTAADREADALFHRVRRVAAQNARLQLDITGLHAGQEVAGAFNALYIVPDIKPETPHARSRLRVVEGAPGAGKSTWSKWLQLRELSHATPGDTRARPRLPVRVELRGMRDTPLPSLHGLIRGVAGPHLAEEITGECVRKWLDDDRVLFILDGFDELAPAQRDAVHAWMLELGSSIGRASGDSINGASGDSIRGSIDGCELIVTSRPLSTEHLQNLGDNWTRSRMQAFDEARVAEYIRRWHEHVPLVSDSDRAIDAEALAGQWASDPTIGPLTGNPLLLCTLLMVHRLDGELPRGRAELYKRYVDGMLGLWDSRRQVSATDVHMTQSDKHRVLRELALDMHFAEVDQLDEEPTRTVVARALAHHKASPDQALTILRERSGLLVGPGVYTFIHRSVAEYLVAEAVKDGDQMDAQGNRVDRLQLYRHRHDDRWHTVLFLWAGLAPNRDVEEFIRTCLEQPTGEDVVLAIGLLEDRVGRLDDKVIRELMMLLIGAQVDVIPDDGGRYACNGPRARWSPEAVRVPGGCGLARQIDLPRALVTLIRQVELSWDDCSRARGPVRLLLAQAFLNTPGRAPRQVWVDLYGGSHDERALCVRTMSWLLEYGSPAERTGLRETLRAHVPELVAGDTFLAMGSLVHDIDWLYEGEPHTGVHRSMVSLARTDIHAFDATWLRWSHEWMFSGPLETECFDLLQKLEDLLPTLIVQVEDLTAEELERVQSLVRAMQSLVRAMKEQRAALPPDATP